MTMECNEKKCFSLTVNCSHPIDDDSIGIFLLMELAAFFQKASSLYGTPAPVRSYFLGFENISATS